MAEPPPAASGPAPVAHEAGPLASTAARFVFPNYRPKNIHHFNIPPQSRMHGADAVPCMCVCIQKSLQAREQDAASVYGYTVHRQSGL